VPGWVTCLLTVNHLGAEPGTQAYSAVSPPSVVRVEWAHGETWESKQAYRMTHQLVSVVLQCLLNGWLKGLASGDHHRLTGSGSALRAYSQRCVVQIHSLLYFTYLLYKWFVVLRSEKQTEEYKRAACVIQSTLDVQVSLLSASVTLQTLHRNCADENVSDTSASLLVHDTKNHTKNIWITGCKCELIFKQCIYIYIP